MKSVLLCGSQGFEDATMWYTHRTQPQIADRDSPERASGCRGKGIGTELPMLYGDYVWLKIILQATQANAGFNVYPQSFNFLSQFFSKPHSFLLEWKSLAQANIFHILKIHTFLFDLYRISQLTVCLDPKRSLQRWYFQECSKS